MATRVVTSFVPQFDDDGNLISFSAIARIDGTGSFIDGEGRVVTITRRVSYEVGRESLPAQFIIDMEAAHQKVVTRVDAAFPMP